MTKRSKNNRRQRGHALLVARRTIVWRAVAVLVPVIAAAALVITAHDHGAPRGSLFLEAAAALLIAAAVLIIEVPLRVGRMNRRLERTLIGLRDGTLDAGDSSLGPLGTAFQEQYRLLRRSTLLQRGTIAVQDTLIENLVNGIDGRVVVLDGQGRVRYGRATAEGESGAVTTEPPIHQVVTTLLNGDRPERVTMDGSAYHCYGIFGPVSLRRSVEEGTLLEPREGLAFIVLSRSPIENPTSRPPAPAGRTQAPRGGVIATLERLFSGRSGRTGRNGRTEPS